MPGTSFALQEKLYTYLAVAASVRPWSSSRADHKAVGIIIQVTQQRLDVVELVPLDGGQEIRRVTDVEDDRVTTQAWKNVIHVNRRVATRLGGILNLEKSHFSFLTFPVEVVRALAEVGTVAEINGSLREVGTQSFCQNCVVV